MSKTTSPAGNTQRSREASVEPRLPHERDESVDSQRADDAAAANAPLGRQAHEDVQRGLVDTDLGPVLDEAYHKVRSPQPRKRPR